MSLRTRLIAALLALALLPTAVFTLFTLVELDRATQGWFRPGVDRALQSAQQLSRTALSRMEATARAQASAWTHAVPTGRLDPASRTLVREAWIPSWQPLPPFPVLRPACRAYCG